MTDNPILETPDQVEQYLYESERKLIEMVRDPKFPGYSLDGIKKQAKAIADNWVRYTRMPRVNGVTPKTNLAIKHTLVLLGLSPLSLEEGLGYKNEKVPETEIARITIYNVKIDNAIGLISKDGTNHVPYRIVQPENSPASLEWIRSCSLCPVRGRCDLVDRCNSYDAEQYKCPENLKIEDYRKFDEHAKTVRGRTVL